LPLWESCNQFKINALLKIPPQYFYKLQTKNGENRYKTALKSMKKIITLLLIVGIAKGFAQSWQPLPMFGGGFITNVVVHPTNPSIIVGVCDVGGLFISTDDCQTWTSHTANVPKTDFRNFYIRSFAFDPTTPTTQYYLSGDAPYNSTGKIFKTENNGTSWAATSLPVNVSGNSTGYAGETILVKPTFYTSVANRLTIMERVVSTPTAA
jgi:hypothetical protein